MHRDDIGILRVLDAEAVEAIDWEPLHDLPGVTHKVLWQSGDITLGFIRLEPGAEEPGQPHLAAHHHFVVVQGECSIGGRPLTPYSYAYIPPGTEHPTTHVGPDGATVFFSYRPMAPHLHREAPLHEDDVAPI